MKAALELEKLKKYILEDEPDHPTIAKEVEKLFKLCYREAYQDGKSDVIEQREGDEVN